MDSVKHLVYNPDFISFDPVELSEINRRVIEHGKKCPMADIGVSYNVWVDAVLHKQYRYAECFCGTKLFGNKERYI